MFKLLKKNAEKVYLTLLMQSSVQRCLLPFGHELSPDRWIFIVGCYNSGTTLLASVLRKHPLLSGMLNEGAFLTDELPYPEQKGWPRMWSQCFEHVNIDPNEPGAAESAEKIKRNWSLWYPSDSRNLIEKSISNLTRMPYLQEYFKPAYFIYIVRNGYAVSKGIQRKANYKRWGSPYKNGGYPIDLCAGQWRLSDEIAQADKGGLTNFLTVTYEDFTEHPVDTLNTITQFLDISPMPMEIISRGWSVHEFNSKIMNMNAHSLGKLSPKDVEAIERVAGGVLDSYGYTFPKRG
ncbi:MAG: sulfotransferase [Gammaproteobacteria bacterium]|nr:sulfotransferase [Gammaproteobacteria bacterium]